jgi:prepilin-type N-terminal cleavage/methylation domain-containing protein
MKKTNSQKGFTLIELMVAIAIVAVLSTIGITLFQSTQSQARDSRRRQDIDAFSTVLETNFNPTTGVYTTPTAANFAGGTLPVDPLGSSYSTYNLVIDPVDGSSYVVCAQTENNTGNSSTNDALTPSGTLTYYCRVNQQQ